MTLGIDRVKLRRRNHIEQTPARKPRSLIRHCVQSNFPVLFT